MHKSYVNCKSRALPWYPDKVFLEGDYAFASTRARVPIRGFRVGRGYALASHFAAVIAARRQPETKELLRSFRDQVIRWKNETGHLSSITKAIAHPSYLRIIGLARDSAGREIERLLLRELESEPDHWFAALTAVTGEDPVRPEHDFDEAVEAWLAWGHDEGII